MTNFDKAIIALLLLVLVVILSSISAIYTHVRYTKKGKTVINDWANKNGFKLIQCKYSLLGGPFIASKGHGRWVFRITVSDQSTPERYGWIIVMPFPTTSTDNQLEVKWDKPTV